MIVEIGDSLPWLMAVCIFKEKESIRPLNGRKATTVFKFIVLPEAQTTQSLQRRFLCAAYTSKHQGKHEKKKANEKSFGKTEAGL